MRIVILSSGIYSESACAMAAHLSAAGFVPVGALALSTLNRQTLLRKVGQWGLRGVFEYAKSKLISSKVDHRQTVTNPYLEAMLRNGSRSFRSLRKVGQHYGFPVALCDNQNDSSAIAQLKRWDPDLLVFTGGNILRKPVIAVPRLGVLNVHLGLLPEIKGMSSPEWSLLSNVPVGVTIHFMDAGIDTGPILQKGEWPDKFPSISLIDLRNRLIAFGIGQLADVVRKLERGTISATTQSEATNANRYSPNQDRQFFVIHDRLRDQAQKILLHGRAEQEAVHG